MKSVKKTIEVYREGKLALRIETELRENRTQDTYIDNFECAVPRADTLIQAITTIAFGQLKLDTVRVDLDGPVASHQVEGPFPHES